MELTSAFVTVFAGSKCIGQRQSKNTCQTGLWPDASAAHPERYKAKEVEL